MFADAVKHIFGLMAKDSYVRFCGSEWVLGMLSQREREREREREGGLSGAGVGAGGKKGARSSKDMLQ